MKIKEAIRMGRKLRRLLWEKWNNFPEVIQKKGRASRETRIKVLRDLTPDWAKEIALLTYKDFRKKRVFWTKNPGYLLGLEFTRPIL